MEKDCRARGLNREDALDRSRWRKQIGMIDDHNECGWVNVSSGTGSPGLSRINSTEPYNGCACLLYVVNSHKIQASKTLNTFHIVEIYLLSVLRDKNNAT